MNTTTLVVIAVVAVVLGVIAFLVVRRQRYVRALRGRGWIFASTPPLSSVLDHHAPPFGLGFERATDEGSPAGPGQASPSGCSSTATPAVGRSSTPGWPA